MVTTSQVMLGKLPTRVDPRTLSLARYLDRELLPAPPPELDLSERVISTGRCTRTTGSATARRPRPRTWSRPGRRPRPGAAV